MIQIEANRTEPVAERASRRAPAPVFYWLLAKNENGRIGVLTLHRGAEEVLPVFGHEEEAEIFLGLGGAADDCWQARESSAGELVSMLYGPCAGVDEVALDPLPEMLSESTVGLVSLPRERFIEYITAGRRPLGSCEDERDRGSEAGWTVAPEVMMNRKKKQTSGAPREAEDQTVTVLLANGHRLLRRGLKELLSGDASIEVVGEAVNEAHAVTLARETKPHVVVLDDGLGAGAGKAVERMLEISPPPEVVIAAQDRSSRFARKLLNQGASAYLGMDASPEDLLAAVRTASRGPCEDNAFLAAPRAPLTQAEQDEKSTPSSRELEILLLAARGSSNRRIASSLRIAESTVKRHLANLYHKMGVGCRGEAVHQALSEGWISVRDIVRAEEHTRHVVAKE